MGPLGWQETVFIFVLALLLFGPKKLPELGRTIGKALTEFRRASNELKATFDRELSSIERENESLKEVTNSYANEIGSQDYNYDYNSDYNYNYDSSYNEGGSESASSEDSTATNSSTVSASASEGAESTSGTTPEGTVSTAIAEHSDGATRVAAADPAAGQPASVPPVVGA